MGLFSKPLPAVVPVPPASLDEHFRQARDARRREVRRERRFGMTKTAAIVALAGYAGWLIWRNEQLVRLAAENANRVIYVYAGENGTLTNSAAYSSLPVKFQTDNVLNSLWNYVYWRECWSPAEAPRAYYNVQRMSDERVRKEWLEYMANSNELSPQNRLGKRNRYYTCEPIAYNPSGEENNRYEFRFMRYEHDPQGRRDAGISMHVTVAFRTGVYPTDEQGWIDRTVYNAPGLQIWNYPGARPDAVQQHLLVQAGDTAK